MWQIKCGRGFRERTIEPLTAAGLLRRCWTRWNLIVRLSELQQKVPALEFHRIQTQRKQEAAAAIAAALKGPRKAKHKHRKWKRKKERRTALKNFLMFLVSP